MQIYLGKSGGIETYARNLVRALQDVDAVNEYLLLCTVLNEEAFPLRRSNFKKIISGKSRAFENMKFKALTAVSAGYRFMDGNIVLRNIKNTVRRGVVKNAPAPAVKVAGENRCDIVHYLFSNLPHGRPPGASSVVLTVVDIQHEYFPEFFYHSELERRKREYRESIEKADHIIAISEFTKKTLVEKYATPMEKISVVYLGYDSNTYKKLDKDLVEVFRKRYGLPGKFLLYPAATWSHKNHLNLIKAYKILKDRYRFDAKLILTGVKKGNHDLIMNEIKSLGFENEIIYLGYLPYPDLPLLYNSATLLVFPSLFEGFGMPVVEAMATGLPVVCSNTTSLPEVGGDAAVYFDPQSPADIADKVFKAYNDAELRERLVKKGFEHARRFTWENTAKETLKVYEGIFSDSERRADTR
ncbi:MAG: glycosyltransferase family 4 protein [Deltaproteobacteria bacterium]|nr:glycosyltransferase family 4 protein [Deltaproteobacteria bacterium]